MRRLEGEAKEVTTILTNILIFIVATIVFVRTSDRIHEIYKLPGLLMPSILSVALFIFTDISSIACTYTEYRMAAELFASEGKANYAVFSFGLIVCFVICFLTICNFVSYYNNFPLVELLACYKQVDSSFGNTPRIPYSTFNKMYKLHPENFQFIDNECLTFYSFRYRGKRFSLNFLDFIRALSLIDEHITEKDLARERAKRVKKYEEQAKLYAMMRDDLACDLAAIEKQKTDAYDKIKTSTDNINEIANRLIKEAH
jgi:hypothetical protein